MGISVAYWMPTERVIMADKQGIAHKAVHQESALGAEIDAAKVAQWNPTEVAKWASEKGFQEFAPALLQHQISGAILPMLGEPQLREIGFGLVGPRMQFQKELQEIQRGARMKQRNEVLWEADEERMGPCGGCCPFGFPFCCWAQPPAHYKLSNMKLSISEADVSCGGFTPLTS